MNTICCTGAKSLQGNAHALLLSGAGRARAARQGQAASLTAGTLPLPPPPLGAIPVPPPVRSPAPAAVTVTTTTTTTVAQAFIHAPGAAAAQVMRSPVSQATFGIPSSEEAVAMVQEHVQRMRVG